MLDFLGTVIGSAIGLVAILLGALFNAQKMRERDDRINEQHAKAIATGLFAELKNGILLLSERRQFLLGVSSVPDQKYDYLTRLEAPSLPLSKGLLENISLLPSDTVQKVISALHLYDMVGRLYVLRSQDLKRGDTSKIKITTSMTLEAIYAFDKALEELAEFGGLKSDLIEFRKAIQELGGDPSYGAQEVTLEELQKRMAQY